MLAQQHAIEIVHECVSSVAFFFRLLLFQNMSWWLVVSNPESRESHSKIPTSSSIFAHASAIFTHRCPYAMLARFSESAVESGPIARCKTAKRCCAVCKHRHFCSVCLQTSTFPDIQHRDRCLGREMFRL